jgi:hypothetical protein
MRCNDGWRREAHNPLPCSTHCSAQLPFSALDFDKETEANAFAQVFGGVVLPNR